MNFNNGNDNNNNKSSSHYVRAVRSGKCSLLAFEAVYNAYIDCRKRKRGTINALKFEHDLLANLFELTCALQNGTYRPSRSVCFITPTPKFREIFAADFRDRVVHHLVVRALEEVWEPIFIHDSYASRVGKGIHSATKRLQRFMLKASKNKKRTAYYLQLDIKSFFMSIDKDILFSILEKTLLKKREDAYTLLYVLERIVYHDCTQNYYFKGNPGMLEQVPPSKSLFKRPKNQGMPIGNLTSQFFANLYLNELDQFVKHALKAHYYLRYVDDFVLVSEDAQELEKWRQEIQYFLNTRLRLDLKNTYSFNRVTQGADFLGYIVRPGYILSRNRVVNNLKYTLAVFKQNLLEMVQIEKRTIQRYIFPQTEVVRLRQVLSSYLGHFSHANTYKLVQSIFRSHPWLNEFFIYNNGKLYDKFSYYSHFRCYLHQVWFFRYRLSESICLFQVGRYYELYNECAVNLASILRLCLIKSHRGIDYAAGFPEKFLEIYREKILAAGFNLAIIDQECPGKFIMKRRVKSLYKICHT